MTDQSLSIKFFIEQFNDDLITVDLEGKVFFINMQFITDLKDFNWIQVNSNLNSQDIKIKDVLILNTEIYISYAEFGSEAKNCETINISKAKISKKELNFKIFFKSKACERLFNAGRMVFYNHDGKEGLLVTTSAPGIQKNLAQDDNSPFGKILFIDFETNNYTIFSKGHREPQGLAIEGKFILSAEHGPRGGDEINLIQFGQNYGWPISSYGEPYLDLEKSSKVYDYLKNLSDYTNVVWFGSRIEPHITDKMILRRGCNFDFKLRPKQREIFENLDTYIEKLVVDVDGLRFVSQNKVFRYQFPEDFMSCNGIYWRDETHLSDLGIKRMSKRFDVISLLSEFGR